LVLIPAAILLLAASTSFDESYRAGLRALQQNRLEEARRNLESASKAAPENGRVWLALAQTYWKLQESGKANEAAERAAKLGAHDAQVLRLLTVFYAETGQYQAAIRLNPYEESNYFTFANRLLQQQKFEPAIEILLAGKRNFDKSAQIELALGVAYYGLRRYTDAATAFQRTISLAPDIEQPYLFLGKMLDQIPDKAPELSPLFESYEKAHPQSYAGYLVHAKALIAQSAEPELAERLLKKASSLNGDAAEPHYELGALLQRARKWDDAAVEFERAAALEPSDPATHYHLAQVYDRLGKRDAAAAERERHARLMETGRQ
jgi:tetratricopeptide (TPR) repeat protein